MSERVSVQTDKGAEVDPVFGDFDGDVVDTMLTRHADAGAEEGRIAFVDRLETPEPVSELGVPADIITECSREHLNTDRVMREMDIVVGIELPSGRIIVIPFKEPDERNWEQSELRAFLQEAGVQPASLEDAIGSPVKLDAVDGQYVPEALADDEGGKSSVEASEARQAFRLSVLWTVVVLGLHATVALFIGHSLVVGASAVAWIGVLGLISWSIHQANKQL